MHILMNMLGLYFLGPTLERHWGTRKFLPFYLGCGVAGALFYIFLVAVNFLPPGQMVGASGAILGMLAACAILFPHFVVFIYFFPLPIRIAALALIIWYLVAIVTKALTPVVTPHISPEWPLVPFTSGRSPSVHSSK